MNLSFALPSNKPAAVGAAPSLKRPAFTFSLDDDEPMDAAPTLSDDRKATVAVNKQMLAKKLGTVSKTTRKKMEAEMQVDNTVYEYDEVWDKMQETKLRQKETKELDTKLRKPKYIDGLLSTAATRKLDHLRAEEKMMQREREREGDEFKDKEVFVTQAYKDQMEEVRKAEEEEKMRDALAKKNNRGISTGMTHFYRKLLEESEQKHEETVAATAPKKPVIGPQGPNFTISKPANYAPKSDLELALIAREQGKEVELNDDNQIVDKRQLLSAGLNLSAPNTRKLGLVTAKLSSGNAEPVQIHTAVGTAASRREIEERRKREILIQLEEEQLRVANEVEQRERAATQQAIARRNTQEDVHSARKRYLERKRRKMEESNAALDVP